MGAAVIAGVDASPVFQPCKHVLDAMALLVEGAIVVVLDFALGVWRDAWRDPAFGKRLAEPAGVIGAVGEHGLCGRQGVDHHRRTFVVAGLSGRQAQQNGAAAAVAYGVKLAGQTAAAASDAAG